MKFDRALVRVMTGEINTINELLADHRVNAGVVPADAHITPAWLQYRITLGKGVRVSRVVKLRHELSEVVSRYRKRTTQVRLMEVPLLLEVPHPDPKPLQFAEAEYRLPPHAMLVGESYEDQATQHQVIDFTQTPHVLIAATTGEGKSVLMTGGILSLAEHNAPETLVLHLIDLKNDDLMTLQELPQVDRCAGDEATALEILQKLNQLKVARIKGADKSVRHVVCIDELAELARNQKATQLLESLLAMGRSLNINIVGATQHPLSSVIGSLIKANFTARLVGRVLNNDASKVASGLPKLGAELLPGKGSFILVDGSRIVRVQAYLVSQADAQEVVLGVRNRYLGEGEGTAAGAMLSRQLAESARLEKLGQQAGGAYAADVLEYASRPEVVDVFARYYDTDTGEMRYGWQAQLVKTIFGANANRGGWNRAKVLAVVAYLRNYPPSG